MPAGAPKGNKNAATGASIRDAIRYEAAKLGRQLKEDGLDDDTALAVGLRAIVAPHVAKAAEGDHAAFKEIADRIDGKAHQSTDMTLDATIDANLEVDFLGRTE